MRKPIIAAVIAASAATSACGEIHHDDGATVSRSYEVGNFQEIEVAGPYDVQVRTGGNPGVSARGSEKLLERTVVEVQGDKLLIRPQNNHGWFHFGWSSHGHANFTVTVPQLNRATIAGSGDINVDKVQADQFEGTVAGSGTLGLGQLKVQSLKLSIAGSGDAKAGSGEARSAQYDIAGSGGVDAANVATQALKASIAGSGSIKAHSSGLADVSIMGSGDVAVTGGAKCTIHKAGSGDVSCS